MLFTVYFSFSFSFLWFYSNSHTKVYLVLREKSKVLVHAWPFVSLNSEPSQWFLPLQWFFHVHFILLWKSTSVPQESPFTPLNGILISLPFWKEYFGFFRKRKMEQKIWSRKVKWETGESLMLKQHISN